MTEGSAAVWRSSGRSHRSSRSIDKVSRKNPDSTIFQLSSFVNRKRVRHKSPLNYQLDLFCPDDGYYEYSAVVTNKAVTGRTLWFFMCGRGTHEKVYGELKSGFAFDCIPTQRYQANSAWSVTVSGVSAVGLLKWPDT